MSRILRKDTIHAITSSWPRFVSIACLMLLGAFALVGLKVTGPNMRATAASLFEQTRLADLTVISTWGLDDTDQDILDAASGVRDVEYGQVVDTLIAGSDTSVRVFSAPERISKPAVVAGALPGSDAEITLDFRMEGTYQIGDTIYLDEPESDAGLSATDDDDDDSSSRLRQHAFRVVGFAKSAEFTDSELLGKTTVGTGQLDHFAFVDVDAFDVEVHTIARLLFDDTEGAEPYDAGFLTSLDQHKTAIEDLLVSQPQSRLNVVVADAQDQLDDARAEIADAQSKLDDGRADLNDAAAKLKDARAELKSGQQEYDAKIASAKADLRSGADRLAAANAKVDAKATQLGSAAQQIKRARAEAKAKQQEVDSQRQVLNRAQRDLDAQRAALADADAAYRQQIQSLQEQIAAAEAAGEDATALVGKLAAVKAEHEVFVATVLNPGSAKLDAKQQELDTASAKLAAAQGQLDAAATQLDQKQAQYDASAAELADARAKIARQQKALDAARAEFEKERKSGAARLKDAAAQIKEKQADYDDAAADFADDEAEAITKIADKTAEIDEAQADLDALQAPTYTVADRRDFPGYHHFGDNATRIDVLSQVFPVFLFAIAALVSLTTMTRMVEEQRITNGTLAALGYTPAAIRRKYLVYGISASLLGSIVGVILGHTLLPTVIFNAYSAHFVFPGLELSFHPVISVITILVAIACTVVVAAAVATRELREKPAVLLLPKPPAVGSRILLERVGWLWKRMSFTYKVTARNLFRYKKRMFMTIFGVAGCVSLLICGFGLRDSLAGIVTTQFDGILHYDLIAVQQDDATDSQRQQIAEAIAAQADFNADKQVHYEQLTVPASPKSAQQDVTLLVPGDAEAFAGFISLRDRASGAPFTLGEHGVIVSEKLAHFLRVGVGSTITLDDADGTARDFTIGAITEMYVGHYVFLDRTGYQEIFEAEPVDNATLLALSAPTAEKIQTASAALMSLDGIRGVVQVAAITSTIESIMEGLGNVILVLIVASILLALVVIFNLTNINVSERIRELSTIKVLGFYPREVTLYIYRETVVLTLLGILAGYAVGAPLHAFIIDALPPDDAMFTPGLLWSNIALSAGITLIISIAVAFVIHVRLKRVNMLEALKSVE